MTPENIKITKIKEALKPFGKPYVLEFYNTYFLQIITDRSITEIGLLIEIADLFYKVADPKANLWVTKIFNSEAESYTERARLLTIPDKFMERMLTTTTAANDAYIKMREIDASYIDFAGHYALPNAVTTIDFMQDNQPGFARYTITENAQYSAIEIYGQRHTVCTEVKNNGSHFSVDIRPMPMADIALG